MKLAIIGAALAALPMHCAPRPTTEFREPVPYAPAVRIPYPDRCEELRTADVAIDPSVQSEHLAIWYLDGTDTVFGYSRNVKSNIYPTVDCLEQSP